MRKTKIVTHNGKAHRDEYLACCVIMYHAYRHGELSFVERRMVGESDLVCPDTWVIDTGGRWQPELRNFDHHQDASDVEGLCAFDLVMMNFLGPKEYRTYKTCSPWVKLTALHDTSGGQVAAASLGCDMKSYLSTRSPVEKAMLGMFSDLNVIHPESPLAYCMRETGRVIVVESEEITSGIQDRISETPPPFSHGGLKIWDVRSAWGKQDQVSMAVITHAASARSVDVVIGRNNRTGGVGIYRSSWAEGKLNLTRLRGEPGVQFVHKNGFYAVVSDSLMDSDIASLILRAAAQSPDVEKPQVTENQ